MKECQQVTDGHYLWSSLWMYSCRYRAKPVHDLWQKTGSPSCHKVESRDTLGDHVGAESLVGSHGSLCAADSCQGVIHVPTPHTVEHHCPQWLAVHCPILWSVNSTRLAGHKIPPPLSHSSPLSRTYMPHVHAHSLHMPILCTCPLTTLRCGIFATMAWCTQCRVTVIPSRVLNSALMATTSSPTQWTIQVSNFMATVL